MSMKNIFAILALYACILQIIGASYYGNRRFNDDDSETEAVDTGDKVSIPSNCIGLSDGYYYLKLLEGDEYPIIYAKCSNEYLLLDVSLDEDIKSYFNSFEMYHIAVAGPTNEYPINWDNWFLPNIANNDEGDDDEDTKTDIATHYVISPDCGQCEVNNIRQLYDEKTVYMMTGSMFGCYWNAKYEHIFDQDFNSYQCYYDLEMTNNNVMKQEVGMFMKYPLTDESTKHDWDHSGSCAFNVRPADLFVADTVDHESCTTDFTSV